MNKLNTKIINLIERAARRYNAIMPCHGDWERSYTIESGRVILWFNYSNGCEGGLTTGLIREDNNN